jgi:hypothetical protein
MPKCQYNISKGKNSGKECGIYTAKEHSDNKYYCASHSKMVTRNPEYEKENKPNEILKLLKHDSPEAPKPIVSATVPIVSGTVPIIEPPKPIVPVTLKKIEPPKPIIEPISEDEEDASSELIEKNIDEHDLEEVMEYEFKKKQKLNNNKTQFDVLNENILNCLNKIQVIEMFLFNKSTRMHKNDQLDIPDFIEYN